MESISTTGHLMPLSRFRRKDCLSLSLTVFLTTKIKACIRSMKPGMGRSREMSHAIQWAKERPRMLCS